MLTELQIKAAKPSERDVKFSDERGLHLLVKTNGAKLWQYQYRFNKKQKTLSLGQYPVVKLADARAKLLEARKLLDQGVDPSEAKKLAKEARHEAFNNSFESVARSWVLFSKHGKAESYQHHVMRRLEIHFLPWLGKKPIDVITPVEILNCVKRISDGNKIETAHRVLNLVSQIFKYAKQNGKCQYNPASDLTSALPKATTKHMASFTQPQQVAELMRAIEGFTGSFTVQQAMKLSPLVFVRPGELRKAKWRDIDLTRGEWTYLVTKTNTEHLVPLSRQAIQILTDIKPLSGNREYVFMGGHNPLKAMSEAAINAALRRMGYDTKTEITGHGFRAMARTILHERLEIEPAIIEHQLAHAVPDALGRAYNRTRFIEKRVEMMQIWADYLDEIKASL